MANLNVLLHKLEDLSHLLVSEHLGSPAISRINVAFYPRNHNILCPETKAQTSSQLCSVKPAKHQDLTTINQEHLRKEVGSPTVDNSIEELRDELLPTTQLNIL